MTDTLERARELLRAAEAAHDLAKEAYDHASQEDYMARRGREVEDMMGMPNSFFEDGAEAPYGVRPYILPFGKGYAGFNPLSNSSVENHEFGPTWTAYMTAIICQRIDVDRLEPSRLIWTSGYCSTSRDHVGATFEARHDQTNAKLGVYRIVGLAMYGPNGYLLRTIGNVPDKEFRQSTYK